MQGLLNLVVQKSKRSFVNTITKNKRTLSYKVAKRSSLMPENSQLFKGENLKPELNLNEIDPQSLVLVHRTRYFPKMGKFYPNHLQLKKQPVSLHTDRLYIFP